MTFFDRDDNWMRTCGLIKSEERIQFISEPIKKNVFMRSTHTFSIDFIIRKCKTNKMKSFIYARITVDGEEKEVSLKEQINTLDWDSKTETISAKGQAAKYVNQVIHETRARLRAQYRLLQENHKLITAETIKQAYLGEHEMLKGHSLLELLDYYHKIWQPKLKKGGYKNIETTIKYVKNFLTVRYKSGNIYLSQLSMELATDFEDFVRNNPVKKTDPCLGNGLGKHMQRFKTIVNWAVTINWISANPFERYSCPLKRTYRRKLTTEELFKLQDKPFLDPTLGFVKDLFMYSCYTGLAFVDAMSLKKTDFEFGKNGKVWCKIYRTKSEGFCPVPLLKTPIAIIKKYENHPLVKPGYVFPRITNQHVNRCLSIIREACGIETPITFHVARHTFAKTIALKNGVPMETIQIMMGHSKIATTQIYADVDEEKIANDMRGVENKLNKKRSRKHEEE